LKSLRSYILRNENGDVFAPVSRSNVVFLQGAVMSSLPSLFIFFFIGLHSRWSLHPRLSYVGLSALFGDEPSPLQFSVRISCSVL